MQQKVLFCFVFFLVSAYHALQAVFGPSSGQFIAIVSRKIFLFKRRPLANNNKEGARAYLSVSAAPFSWLTGRTSAQIDLIAGRQREALQSADNNKRRRRQQTRAREKTEAPLMPPPPPPPAAAIKQNGAAATAEQLPFFSLLRSRRPNERTNKRPASQLARPYI